MTAVSVAMCTRNGARHVATQLRSIVEGERAPDEVVISDDASTDGTPDLVADLARAIPGIRFVLLRNEAPLGVTKNFERACRATTGDIVILSDQDDVWHPDRVDRALGALDQPDALLHHADADLVDDDGSPLGVTLYRALRVSDSELGEVAAGRGFGVLLRRNIVTGAVTAFRRSLLHDALPFPLEWVHDEWLAILAAARGGLRSDRASLIDYRQHGANAIGARRLSSRERIARMLEPDSDRLPGLSVRAGLLAARLGDMGLGLPAELACRKAEFEARRARLPRLRIARVPGVVALAGSGDYGRFASQRRLDAVRDLLQPKG